MGNSSILLIYGLMFLSGLLLFEGLLRLLAGRSRAEDQVNRRLQLIARKGAGATQREIMAELRRQRPRRHSLLGPLNNPYLALADLLGQSGSNISMRQLLLIMGALGVAGFLATGLIPRSADLPGLLLSPWFSLFVALVSGVALPIKFLSVKKSRRLARFVEQLPEALDIIVRSLKAGHPISTSLGMVSHELPDPIGSEFGIAVDEMTYGLDLREALQNLAERVPTEELHYVVVCIEVQHETGGNLAEILERLSAVIRDRFRMRKKIRALSSEGRMSAVVLCVLPFLTGGAILLMNPKFYLNVVDDPLFWPGMGLAALLMIGGIFTMRRMVSFRI